jgi:hypothetical protein
MGASACLLGNGFVYHIEGKGTTVKMLQICLAESAGRDGAARRDEAIFAEVVEREPVDLSPWLTATLGWIANGAKGNKAHILAPLE